MQPLTFEASKIGKYIFNKVPEITAFFWIIKVLCTTVGETASDFLNVNLNFGLTNTSIVMGVLLVVTLIWQFRTKKYTPFVYWANVVLISVFGTLVTDNLTDNLNVPLEFSTIFFSTALLVTFAVWYWREKTLSIHAIDTVGREAFYWLAVLFTFALGTAAGDLYAEALGLGYATTGLIILGIVALFTVAWRLGLNSILVFWVVYIMTRPLGASIGDFLTQTPAHGGMGLGATLTTLIFTAGIVGTVLYLAIFKPDVTTTEDVKEEITEEKTHPHILAQVIVVALLFLIASVGGYYWRQHQLYVAQQAALSAAAATPGAQSSPLGDLSNFESISQATLDSVNAGDWSSANSHANDLEYAWDHAEAQLKPLDQTAWTHVDGAIDKVLREVRAVNPNVSTAQVALQKLLGVLGNQ